MPYYMVTALFIIFFIFKITYSLDQILFKIGSNTQSIANSPAMMFIAIIILGITTYFLSKQNQNKQKFINYSAMQLFGLFVSSVISYIYTYNFINTFMLAFLDASNNLIIYLIDNISAFFILFAFFFNVFLFMFGTLCILFGPFFILPLLQLKIASVLAKKNKQPATT